MADQALSDVKVLDLTWYIAGPYCTKLLADYGADVIKVERPGEGDPARHMGPFLGDDPHPEKSGLFLHLNTGKRGITLNLKSVTGREIFKELVQNVDILVENFSPRVMPSLGLGYEELEKLNPKLVMTSISNFGHGGAYQDHKATDLVECALSGFANMTGVYDREPLNFRLRQPQVLAGLNAAFGTLMAFHCQRETGLGQHVDISIMETLTGVLQYLPVEYAWTGGVKTRTPRGGTGSSFSVPCKDGDVVPVLIGMNLELLGSFLNLPPEGSEALGKIAWRDTRAVAGQVVPLMAKAFEQRGKQELLFSSQEWRFPWTVVQDARDIANCPHLKDRNFFVELNQPGMGKVKLPGAPFVMTETPFQAQPAPLLGEHNEEVYVKHLGYSKEDMVKLREMGAI